MNFISFFPWVIKLHLQVDCFSGMGIYQLKVRRSFQFSCIVTKHNPLKNKMPLRRTEIESKKKWFFKNPGWGLSWYSSVVKNLPASAGDTGSIPRPRGSHMPQRQLSHCTTTTKHVLWNLGAAITESMCYNYWSLRALEPTISNKRSYRNDKPMEHM